MKEFDFNHNSNIIIYGAASTGILLLELFKKGKVKAFIDKRAHEIKSINEVPVISIDESDELLRESVVIVAVKNVFEHNEIAQKLVRYGYNKIIFKPYSVLKGKSTVAQGRLSAIWDLIITKHHLVEETLCCAIDALIYEFSNDSVISYDDDKYICRVPVDLINTDLFKKGNPHWADIPIRALYPHIFFFKNLLGYKNYDVDAYLDFCIDAAKRVGNIDITESWKNSVIQNRIRTFQEMKMSMSTDPDFFSRSAVKVKWNEKGYFNLNSGKHRVAFQVALGHSHIPVSMSKEDYNIWCNESKAKKVYSIMKENGVYAYEKMIMNPFFYNISNKEAYYEEDFIFYVMQLIQSEIIKNEKKLKVLLYAKPNHRLLYLLSRMDVELNYICPSKIEQIDKEISELCRCQQRENNSENCFDFFIADSDEFNIKALNSIYISNSLRNDDKTKVVNSYYCKSGKYKYLLWVNEKG